LIAITDSQLHNHVDHGKLYLYPCVDVQARIKELEEEIEFERSARNKVTRRCLVGLQYFYISHETALRQHW